MVQVKWHDGTVKNVHVDLPLLLKYQVLMFTLFNMMLRFCSLGVMYRTCHAVFGGFSEAAAGGRACVRRQDDVVKQSRQQTNLGNGV